jgi:hypothetical protein
MSATTASYDDDKINISMCIPNALPIDIIKVETFCMTFGNETSCYFESSVVNKPDGFCEIFVYLHSPFHVDLDDIRRSLKALLAMPDTTPLVDRISISIRIAEALPTDQVKVEEFCREQFGNRILVDVDHKPNGFCNIFIFILENEPYIIRLVNLDDIRRQLKKLTAHVESTSPALTTCVEYTCPALRALKNFGYITKENSKYFESPNF